MSSATIGEATTLRERKREEGKEQQQQVEEKQKQGNDFGSRMKKFVILTSIWFLMVMGISYGKSYLFGKKTQDEQVSLFEQHFKSKYVELDAEQLKQYDGTDESKPILLAIQGRLYDVTKGRSYYGPGGGYHIFAGRDASRSFVTGCFDVNSEQCTKNAHDLSDFDATQMNTIKEWMDFYEKSYKFVGTLINSK